jgi:hypothetical protein
MDASSTGLGRRLESICLRALHSERSARHENARSFANEIITALMDWCCVNPWFWGWQVDFRLPSDGQSQLPTSTWTQH